MPVKWGNVEYEDDAQRLRRLSSRKLVARNAQRLASRQTLEKNRGRTYGLSDASNSYTEGKTRSDDPRRSTPRQQSR